MKELSRLVVTLTLIATTAALVLALVENATRAPIAEQQRLRQLNAIAAVLPPFDNHPDQDVITLSETDASSGQQHSLTFYRARRAGKMVGVAFNVTSRDGYSGAITLTVGVDAQEQIIAIEILSQAETPGLGARIREASFTDQFQHRGLDNTDWRVKKDGGDIDQLTGATISPRAVVIAVQRGLAFLHRHREQIMTPREITHELGS
nr:RnfABCDGE type electron transport complex subunit G [uncultured Desulfuromonas sp.]